MPTITIEKAGCRECSLCQEVCPVAVFDMDPATGLSLDVYGSAVNKLSPFFKIRRWRSASPDVAVTVESAPITADVDYRAAVKPVTPAPSTMTRLSMGSSALKASIGISFSASAIPMRR